MLYVIFVAHFVGDFVLQSGWMAVNKSSSWRALSAHVAVYTATLIMLLVWWTGDALWATMWALVNGLAHFVTDAITSRINKRLYVASADDPSRHWFFVGVGADQLVHALTLLITLDYFTVGLLPIFSL